MGLKNRSGTADIEMTAKRAEDKIK